MRIDPVTLILAYLAIGAVLWALMDPVAHRDFFVGAYTRCRGVLPGRGLMGLAIVLAILAWPKMAWTIVKASWIGLR
jgi:hypothetical protein